MSKTLFHILLQSIVKIGAYLLLREYLKRQINKRIAENPKKFEDFFPEFK